MAKKLGKVGGTMKSTGQRSPNQLVRNLLDARRELAKLEREVAKNSEEIWEFFRSHRSSDLGGLENLSVGDRVVLLKVVADGGGPVLTANIGIVIGEALDSLFQDETLPIAVFTTPVRGIEKYARVTPGGSKSKYNPKAGGILAVTLGQFDALPGSRGLLVRPDVEAALHNYDETRKSFQGRHVDIYGIMLRKAFAREVRGLLEEFG
ncbi:MAG: hypothetical protein ACTSU5_22545 [Promethearchaeota archaeon]